MRHLLKPIFIVAVLALGFFAFGSKAQAAGNVVGYAWSNNAGWISMNCSNENTCGTVDYGVNLDETTGIMTGYGWSSIAGWIRFDPPILSPIGTGNRMGGARVVGITGPGSHQVFGWARFCSNFSNTSMPDNCASSNTVTAQNGGWNGWVAMQGASQTGELYGVYFNTDTGRFSGFAWGGTVNTSGSDVPGWISFDGVSIPPKNPVRYIPVISLGGITPILSGGDTDITYKWLNPDSDPLHKFTQCNIFSDPFTSLGPVPNWNNTTFDTNVPGHMSVPTFAAPNATRANVFVYGPATTYYLTCMNVEGVRAADPSNPTVECNPAAPVNTCPRVKVIVTPPTVYTPIIELTSNSPVNTGGTATISYRWTNPDSDPAHRLSDCMSFAEYNGTIDGVTNWTWDTFQVAGTLPTPTATLQSQTDVYVYSPETTYYLMCAMAGGGNYGADPSAPATPCSFASPQTTCPRTKVTVNNTPLGSINLVGKVDGAPDSTYSNAFSVDAGETINLRWSSAVPWTSCVANSPQNPNGWFDGSTKPALTNSPYTRNQGTISVPANPTDYTITCMNANGATTSNTVTVSINTASQSRLSLMIKLDGDPVGTYGTLFSPNQSVSVPQGQNISLHWESNASIVAGSCRASSSPTGYWSGAAVDPAAYPGATTTGRDLDRTDFATTTYTVTCDAVISGVTTQISSSAIAISLPTIVNAKSASISGPTCVKTDSTRFDLSWLTTNLQGGTCTLSAGPAVGAWDGSVSIANNNASATISNMTIAGTTIFRISCVDSSGTAVAPYSHQVVVDQNCTEPPRRNWIFRFFER
jgi:hypothetical protein